MGPNIAAQVQSHLGDKTMIRRLVHIFSLVTLISIGPWAIAQEQEAEEPPTGAAEPAEIVEEEQQGRVFRDKIVVTASRQEEMSGNAPAPITVIDSLMIEQAQPEKMADLFKQIPGVEIEGEGPFRGRPVIRGFSSNRVLILVDGQRLNNARESTTFAGIQPGLANLSEVERIEVLRGPASVQYGSDAIGGVINILTRRPDVGASEFTVNGDVAYGYGTSSDSQNVRAYVSGAGKGWGFTIGAAYQEANDYTAADGAFEDERFAGWVNDKNEVFNSGMKQSSFDASLRFLTGSQSVLRVNAEMVRTDDIGFPGFDLETSVVSISFPRFDRDKLGIAWNSGPVWGLQDISLSTYYQTVDKETFFDFDFGGFTLQDFTHSEIRSLGFNAQSLAEIGSHRLTFGLDFYRDDVEDEAFSESCIPDVFCFPPTTEVGVPTSYQTGLGGYIQDQWSATEALTVHLGLRGDTFDFVSEDESEDYIGEPFDVTDSAPSGNVGVTYAVTDHVNLNAIIARGFRSPNLQERSFTGEEPNTGLFIIQNPDLDSETSLNYEVGFKARYDRYFGGLSVYYNDVQDFITFGFVGPEDPDFRDCPVDPDSGQECGKIRNIAEARIWGIELDLEAIFATWWSGFVNAAYSEGDDVNADEPLSFIPAPKVALGVRYQRPSWWTEASVRIVGDQTRVPEGVDERPGFTTFDLRAGYDFSFGLGVLAALENIADELYAETFNNRPEPGRNLRVSLRYRF
jgi:hemoglobin/transferrin/lactoferrin receptor protein